MMNNRDGQFGIKNSSVHITERMKTDQSGQLNFTLSTDFSPQVELPVSAMYLGGWFRYYLLLYSCSYTNTHTQFRTLHMISVQQCSELPHYQLPT